MTVRPLPADCFAKPPSCLRRGFCRVLGNTWQTQGLGFRCWQMSRNENDDAKIKEMAFYRLTACHGMTAHDVEHSSACVVEASKSQIQIPHLKHLFWYFSQGLNTWQCVKLSVCTLPLLYASFKDCQETSVENLDGSKERFSVISAFWVQSTFGRKTCLEKNGRGLC